MHTNSMSTLVNHPYYNHNAIISPILLANRQNYFSNSICIHKTITEDTSFSAHAQVSSRFLAHTPSDTEIADLTFVLTLNGS